MRHRYRVALYSDHPLEAELADYIEGLDRGRRQEVLRALLRAGFDAVVRGREGDGREAAPTEGFIAPARHPAGGVRPAREGKHDSERRANPAPAKRAPSPPEAEKVTPRPEADPRHERPEERQRPPESDEPAAEPEKVRQGDLDDDLLEEPPSLADDDDFVDPMTLVARKMDTHKRGSGDLD